MKASEVENGSTIEGASSRDTAKSRKGDSRKKSRGAQNESMADLSLGFRKGIILIAALQHLSKAFITFVEHIRRI